MLFFRFLGMFVFTFHMKQIMFVFVYKILGQQTKSAYKK